MEESKKQYAARLQLINFYESVKPLLTRLKFPRYDENETNDYILGSTDFDNAMRALEDIKGKPIYHCCFCSCFWGTKEDAIDCCSDQ